MLLKDNFCNDVGYLFIDLSLVKTHQANPNGESTSFQPFLNLWNWINTILQGSGLVIHKF